MSILLLGATGLVGRTTLRLLLNDPAFGRVVVLTRRPLPLELRRSGATLEEHIVDFHRLRDYAHLMDVEKVICAIGTTIKKAGSREAFREVDFEYPTIVAERSRAHDARHFLLVSALGADPRSRFFYNRVKGDLEDRLRSLAFPGLTILRPSLLLGDREEFRLGEEVAKKLSMLIPRHYKPIPAAQVALALVNSAKMDISGTEILESGEIFKRT